MSYNSKLIARHNLLGCFITGDETISPYSDSIPSDDSTGYSYNHTSARGRISSPVQITTFGDCGIAAMTGMPRWKDNDIALEAHSKGNSAALLMAYNLYGRKLVDHVTGPFSFVIIDNNCGKLLAGVDRLGLETLYYSKEGKMLLFGSTASAILEQQNESSTLCEQGIYDYFYFHMLPSPDSVYSGINKLPAAHCIEVSKDDVTVFRYWRPNFKNKSSQSFSRLGTELKCQLRKAVERSLEDAGTVGTFLSGGLDSSTVTGMLSDITDSNCPAYAIGFDEPGYDEMAFARITAKHFGVSLREYYVTPQDVLDELPTIANSYDEPFGNSSALPAYFCAKMARKDGTDCLLAGDGGDEIFSGNSRYAKQTIFGLYANLPKILRTAVLEPTVNLLPNSFATGNKLKSYITQANIPLPDRLQTYNYLNRLGPSEVFSEDFLEQVNINRPIELLRQTYHALDDASDLSRMQYLDWQYTLADNDLRKVNRMCAIANIGVRYPMLDEELVAFSCEIEDNWKLKRGDLRHFFKKSLSGWLPETTINKKKQGFGLPFGLWMQKYKPLNDMANESVLRLKRRGYFKQGFLDRIVKLHNDEHAAYYGELIWVLTIFDLWLEGNNS